MNKIQTGSELYDFITLLNAEATIDLTLAGILVENAKTILEEERPWMILKKTDTSKTVSSGNTWQTAIDLSTISNFSKFYLPDDGCCVRIFDGNDRIEYYSLKPFDQRLEWKNVSYTCVYDENANLLYLNGTVPFAGTLHINCLVTTDDIDLESEIAPTWSPFPPRFLPLLGYYAIGVFKGAIDYDSINKSMLPSNQAILASLKESLITWDNEKQLAVMQSNDPDDYPGGYPRAGAVNRFGNDSY